MNSLHGLLHLGVKRSNNDSEKNNLQPQENMTIKKSNLPPSNQIDIFISLKDKCSYTTTTNIHDHYYYYLVRFINIHFIEIDGVSLHCCRLVLLVGVRRIIKSSLSDYDFSVLVIQAE